MNKSLTENNYIYIPNFISEAASKVMSRNFKKYCEDNKIYGDPQVPTSSSEYNFIDFLELLCEKTPVVSQIIGETVLPTYSFARVYKDGSVLERHRDRDACEVSLTIHLEGDQEWPIYIQTPDGEEVELNLNPGDAMLYLGCVSDHWRNQFLGREYVQVFLHYVRSRGERSYAYFDNKRNPEPKKNDQQKEDEEDGLYNLNSKSRLVDFIQVYENVVPHSLCDEIVNEYKDTPELFPSAVGAEGIIDKSVRNVLSVLTSNPETLNQNFEKRKRLDNEFLECMSKVIQKYRDKHEFVNIIQDSGYIFLKYDVGNFYKQHVDHFKNEPRSVSCSIALNDIDEYDGGEFAFFDKELKYKIKKGSVILFPSNFMFPHEIVPVTKGTRYAIVTWFV